MSKVKQVRELYPNIPTATAVRFLEADKTPTKKYFQYMMKMWSERKTSGNDCPTLVNSLIEKVIKFEDLLPYIENKDIYSKQYNNFFELCKILESAEDLKVMKTFNRDEHIILLDETDEHILLIPKTHIASVKYGANTKWCTASKRDMGTFRRYSSQGVLFYLLDKTNSKKKNYTKVAFFYSYDGGGPLTDNIDTFNTIDARCSDTQMSNAGWDPNILFKLITMMRLYCVNSEKTKKSRKNINTIVENLSSIDFNQLKKDMDNLSQNSIVSDIENLKNKVGEFVDKLQKF